MVACSAWRVFELEHHVDCYGAQARGFCESPSQDGSARRHDATWRRFEVQDPDAFAAAVCDGKAAWIATLHDKGDATQIARSLQQLAEDTKIEDLAPTAWPQGFRPAVPVPAVEPWPPEPFEAYLRAHALYREAVTAGNYIPGSRALVYTCTSMTFCGGHGDRLNGMLSAAVVAILTGRHFFIDSQRPLPLSLVLEPHRLDWRLHGTLATMPASLSLNDDLRGFEADPHRVMDSQAGVLRFVSNQRLTAAALRAAPRQARALGLSPRPKLHALLFRELFRPSAALAQRLAARQLPEGPLIGIHFRAGDQMPERWKDPPRHGLDELDEFLDCAEKVQRSMSDDTRIILFSDTERALELPRVQELQKQGKLLWPSQTDSLVHLDRSPATLVVRGLLQVWADWWTLAFDVDALILCHSGFGATALEIGPDRPAFLGKGCVRAEGSTG